MAIKIPSIKSTKSTTTHVVTYVDGIVIELTGSNTIATRKAAYEKAYALANPVVIPPVKEPEQPASDVTVISHEEFCGLSNVKGKKYKVIAGFYHQTADHTNIEDCVFDLTGVVVQNCYQALRIYGISINTTYRGLTLKNVDGYQITLPNVSDKLYTGSIGTFIDRLTIDQLNVDGGGEAFHADGDLKIGKIWGLLKNFRLSNSVIKNVGSGNVVYIGAGLDAQFENVIFDNINVSNNAHNGLIKVHGNVIAKNVKATNYQGNLIRNWLYSIEGIKTTSISNCIGYRSRKYSLIELQLEDGLVLNGAHPGNADVFNNTAISMATSKDWDGQLVDLYNTGNDKVKSVVNIYNNLGVDLRGTKPVVPGELTNRMNNPEWTKLTFIGNKYFATAGEAVQDTINFKSLFKGIGAQ